MGYALYSAGYVCSTQSIPCYSAQLGSVALSLQIVFHLDQNSNSELIEYIIQPNSQFPDPIFSGEVQYSIFY